MKTPQMYPNVKKATISEYICCHITSFLVWGDHWSSGSQAVGTAGCSQ